MRAGLIAVESPWTIMTRVVGGHTVSLRGEKARHEKKFSGALCGVRLVSSTLFSSGRIKLLSFRGVHLVSGLPGSRKIAGNLETIENPTIPCRMSGLRRKPSRFYDLRKAPRKNSAYRSRFHRWSRESHSSGDY